MNRKLCRLYDEKLVHDIMISTALALFDRMKSNQAFDEEEVYDFIRRNAPDIIQNTIDKINLEEDGGEEEGGEEDEEPDPS